MSYGIESVSIEYIPESERHGRVIDQAPFWFLGNFHFFTIAIGFVGPSLDLGFGSTALAGTLGILFGTAFVALHASQGPQLGLPQMIQSRPQFAASASFNITYAPSVSDYSRYLPRATNPAALIAAVYIGASASAIWLIAVGAWLATRMGAADGLIALHNAGSALVPGFGTLLSLVSVTALVAAPGLNFYSGMLTVLTGLSSLFETQPTARLRVVAIAALCAVATTLALGSNAHSIELLVHYQPKMNLQTGTIAGAEAVVRWRHPERGLILPAQFVPIAEVTGSSVPIGRWVMREACRHARAWQDSGLRPMRIAVNVSAAQLREIVLTEETQFALGILRGLKELNVQLALDDFGTRYSSLSHLKQFPIDILKIDQSFVRDLTTDPDASSIVSAVIGMGKNLGMQVVAE